MTNHLLRYGCSVQGVQVGFRCAANGAADADADAAHADGNDNGDPLPEPHEINHRAGWVDPGLDPGETQHLAASCERWVSRKARENHTE